MNGEEVTRTLQLNPHTGHQRWREKRVERHHPEAEGAWQHGESRLKTTVRIRYTRPIADGETFEAAAADSEAFQPHALEMRDYDQRMSLRGPSDASWYVRDYPDGSGWSLWHGYRAAPTAHGSKPEANH